VSARGSEPSAALLEHLRANLGADHVLVDPDVTARYVRDWTGRFHGEALAVVRPADTGAVAEVVRACGAAGVAVVPQGGNTGLVAGSVPARGEVVLSTERLSGVEAVDVAAGQVTASAGATLAAVQRAARAAGWDVPVDLAARDSATIGGMVATNAGGTRVLRYGSMRHNVLGAETVLGDGTVVERLSGLVKDNTGYDLTGLLCGSEGTLGVVTRARLRLVPWWPDAVAVWAAATGWDDAVALASRLRRTVDGLDGLEAVDRAGLTLVGEHGIGVPLRPVPAVGVLAVWRGRGDPPAALAETVGDRPHAVAVGEAEVARFWAPRERVTETIARVGVPHKLDVTVPLGAVGAFAADVHRVAAAHGLDAGRALVFGHLGDGNLHVNLLGLDPDDDRLDDAVLRSVAGHRGSISAEHGIGTAKARWLHLSRSPGELTAAAAIRAALDPAGIMNPRVLRPPTGPGSRAPA
jgi:FAD/FMN-containing dehydrogenase